MSDRNFLFFVLLTTAQCATVKNRYMQESTLLTDFCFSDMPCDACAPYRAYNGDCNNLKYPHWGSSQGYFLRLLKADKGYDQIGIGRGGGQLPPARTLRTSVIPDEERPASRLTTLWAFFGQFIAQDTAFSGPKNPHDDCCAGGKAVVNKTCASFDLPGGDYHYSSFGKTCEPIVRHKTSQDEKCYHIPVHQRSFGTHFLDLSLVYGNTEERVRSLRSGVNGLLKSRFVNGKEYWPTHFAPGVCLPGCQTCYKSGDARGNQNLVLNYVYNVFLRLHNRICRQMVKINPHWDDYRLFEECRKINVAIFQKISYDDWLPLVIGEAEAAKFHNMEDPEYTSYNPSTHPNTFQEFNYCFRQFHTFVRNTLDVLDESGKKIDELLQKDHFKCPEILEKDNYLDGIGLGASNQKLNDFGYGVSDAIGNSLFSKEFKGGIDLAATDIMRSRENQHSTYCNLVNWIHGTDCGNYESLRHLLSPEAIDKLKKLYAYPSDIDAWIGTLMEKKSHLLGLTCEILTSIQFRNWKVGDRYWYEFGRWFTAEQIATIKKMTLSSVMCNVGNNISEISEDVFTPPSRSNKKVNCGNLDDLDLSLWKDEKKNFRPICSVPRPAPPIYRPPEANEPGNPIPITFSEEFD